MVTELAPSQKLARLETLAQKSGECLFERAKLAAELLADHAWVDEVENTGKETAEEFLHKKFFRDLYGAITLGTLLEIYGQWPEIDDWKKRDFHLMNLQADLQKIRDDEAESRRPNPVETRVTTPTKNGDLPSPLVSGPTGERGINAIHQEEPSDTIARLNMEIAKLKAERQDLIIENRRLIKENKELRKKVARAKVVA